MYDTDALEIYISERNPKTVGEIVGISYNSTAQIFAIIVGVLSLIPMHVLTKVMADLGDLRF